MSYSKQKIEKRQGEWIVSLTYAKPKHKNEITSLKLSRKQNYELKSREFDIHNFYFHLNSQPFFNSSTWSVQCQNLPKALPCVAARLEMFFPGFVHPPRLSKDLSFIVKGVWIVKMPVPENVLRKAVTVQTHFCGSLMNPGTSRASSCL